MKRITQRLLRSQEQHCQAGLHEAGLKLWIVVKDGEHSEKECTVWVRPSDGKPEDKQEVFTGTVRETWIFLEGWRALRPQYKAGLYRKLALVFGIRV